MKTYRYHRTQNQRTAIKSQEAMFQSQHSSHTKPLHRDLKKKSLGVKKIVCARARESRECAVAAVRSRRWENDKWILRRCQANLPLTRSRPPLFTLISPGESLPTYIPNFRTD